MFYKFVVTDNGHQPHSDLFPDFNFALRCMSRAIDDYRQQGYSVDMVSPGVFVAYQGDNHITLALVAVEAPQDYTPSAEMRAFIRDYSGIDPDLTPSPDAEV